MRLGYWSNTVDAIAEKPLLGWGLDASRTFSGVGLHPHNGALQAWLELGALGAAAAALFWAMSLRRLSREGRDLMAAAIAASAGLYLLFEAVGHGIWQEHWLAMGALAAIVGVLGSGPLAPWSTRPNRRSAAKSST